MVVTLLLPFAAAPPVSSGDASSWALVVLTGGGAVGVYTLVKAWLAIRGNVETREASAIANLEKWRQDADHRADAAETRLARVVADNLLERAYSHYWELRAARAERELAVHGIPIPTPPPEPVPRPGSGVL
jgi:hypothetical protein